MSKTAKKALITGITGQDGSYLAEFLLKKGYEVHGLIRRSSTFNTSRIEHLYKDPHVNGVQLFLHYGDLSDSSNLNRILEKVCPDEIYHLGAQSHVRVSFDMPEYTADVTGLGTLCLLDAIRESGIKTRFYQASSSEMFGKALELPLRETTPFYPRSPYGVAKIAGITMCQSYNEQYGTNFISVMPTNLYGEGDNFDFESSHVLPALIRRFHEAKETGAAQVMLWGSGSPKREFLYVDDLASACVFLMNNYDSSEIVNIGTGTDVSIKELAELIAEIVGYEGSLEWDTSKPDGTPRKLLNVDKLHTLGWRHKTGLPEGVGRTYEWYRKNIGAYKNQEINDR